jgi:hypothetical protein
MRVDWQGEENNKIEKKKKFLGSDFISVTKRILMYVRNGSSGTYMNKLLIVGWNRKIGG